MVFKKVLVGDISLPLDQSGSQEFIGWSGRLPQFESVSFVDNQDKSTELRHEAVQSLVCIVNKQEHARRRRPWTRSFSPSALKDYESLVIKRTLQLMEVVSSKSLNDVVDLKKWIDYFR